MTLRSNIKPFFLNPFRNALKIGVVCNLLDKQRDSELSQLLSHFMRSIVTLSESKITPQLFYALPRFQSRLQKSERMIHFHF